MGRILLLILTLFSFFSFAPGILNKAEAQTICKGSRPSSAPVLLSAESKDKSVVLTWTPAADPVTHYLLSYGPDKDNMEYGNPNFGNRETTTYTVTELQNGVKYYFKIRAENGCKAGKFSNKLSATPGTVSGNTSGGNTPNLSIYKSEGVMGVSASATPTIIEEKIDIQTPKPIAVVDENFISCADCIGWQLLLGEFFLLVFYFFLSRKITFLKQIFSVIIPVGIYITFKIINANCPMNNFYCEYFLQLNIIIFMVAVVLYKNKFISRKISVLEDYIDKEKKK